MSASPMTLLRLAWRPLTILQVLAAVFIYFLPLVTRPIDGALQSIWHGTATPHQRLALWRAVILFPGFFGLFLGYYRLELQHTLMSWPLPAMRRGLIRGAATVALTLALVGSWLMLRNANPSLAIAAFAIALVAFALGWFLYDVAVPWLPRAAAVAVLLAAAFSPAWLATRAESHPLLAAALALSALAPVMSATVSVPLARRRVLLGRYFDPSGPFPFAISGITRPDEWRLSLVTERLLPWIRAAVYESTRRYPRDYIMGAIVIVLLARVTGITAIPIVALCTWLISSGVRLHELWYPLSRAKRARVAYGGMLVDAATYIAVLSLIMLFSYALPLPTVRILNIAYDTDTPRIWAFTIMTAAAFTPIAQWAQLHWPDSPRKRHSSWRQWAMLWRVIIFMIATGIWVGVVGDNGSGEADAGRFLLLTLALAVGMQVVSWFRVRQHYLYTDLVRRG